MGCYIQNTERKKNPGNKEGFTWRNEGKIKTSDKEKLGDYKKCWKKVLLAEVKEHKLVTWKHMKI